MLKLQSTIIYPPGTLIRIKKTNKFGIIMSLHEEGVASYTYNVVALNTSKWYVVRMLQLCLIKKLLK